jgi:hypothetical protein
MTSKAFRETQHVDRPRARSSALDGVGSVGEARCSGKRYDPKNKYEGAFRARRTH